MPTKAESTDLGRVEPPFEFDTQTPHTVTLMLNATEEDLILKSCQSLYKFAHEGEINQTLLMQYDILRLLLGHMRHTNRSVRRMAAMTLNELAINPAVQKVLLLEGGVVELISNLVKDDDRVVDEFICGALNKMAVDSVGKAILLKENAIHALIKRLTSSDPDVLKNCLDTLLAIMEDFQAIDEFVSENGIESCIALFKIEPPILLSLALEALRKAMYIVTGRKRLRDVGGLEDLLMLLETPGQEPQRARVIAVLEHATLDPKNIRAMSRNGGLLRMVQLSRGGKEVEVLQKCGAVMGHLGGDELSRGALHELGAEAVIVNDMLSSQALGSQTGGALAVTTFSQMPEAQDLLVELGAVPLLVAMLSVPETSRTAAMALAAITRGHEAGCRQTTDGLSKLVEKLANDDEETAAHAASAIANLAAQEATRPAVATSRATDRLLACLTADSASLLVAACEALGVVCLSLKARHQLLEHGGIKKLLELFESDYPEVRTAAMRTLQVAAADSSAAEQLCKAEVIAALRSQHATSALKITLQVNIPALYSQFGRLSEHHRLSDGFFDVGRQVDSETVPDLITELERPPSPSRMVFLLNSGVCPTHPEQEQEEKEPEKKKRTSPRRGSPRRRKTEQSAESNAAPAHPEPPEDHRLAAYVAYVRASIMTLESDREQAAALARFVSERLGGSVSPAEFPTWSAESYLTDLCGHRACNVLPIGELSMAGLRCRALLFKFLADQIYLPCTLNRGNYSKYWNTVLVADENPPAFGTPLSGIYNQVIVDLIHQPGTLMPNGAREALEYTTGL